MTVVTLEVRMEGPPELCKEVAAVELERSLRQLGWARVRVVSAVEERAEQMRMGGSHER